MTWGPDLDYSHPNCQATTCSRISYLLLSGTQTIFFFISIEKLINFQIGDTEVNMVTLWQICVRNLMLWFRVRPQKLGSRWIVQCVFFSKSILFKCLNFYNVRSIKAFMIIYQSYYNIHFYSFLYNLFKYFYRLWLINNTFLFHFVLLFSKWYFLVVPKLFRQTV